MSRWRWLLAAVVIAPVLVVGFVLFERVTHRPEFCATCHEMQFYVDTWSASSHRSDATCTSCHTGPGVAGYVDEKARALRELVAHFTGDYTVPISSGHRVNDAQCQACHTDVAALPGGERTSAHGAHLGAAVLCAECHGKVVHVNAPAGEQRLLDNAGCEACHQAHDGFAVADGAHATLDCAACHSGGIYTTAVPACEACHRPPAVHAGRDTGCEDCHSVEGWAPAILDHSQTGFVLTGKHVSLTCAQCHGDPLGQPAGATCASCHQAPASHAGMSTACEGCHGAEGFTPARFTHARVGEHMPAGEVRLACGACHRTEVFAERHCTGAGCHATDRGGDDDD